MPGVFVKAGNQGDKWHTAGVSVSLGSAPGFWVRFRAIRGINTNSDVAIEELRLTLYLARRGVGVPRRDDRHRPNRRDGCAPHVLAASQLRPATQLGAGGQGARVALDG